MVQVVTALVIPPALAVYVAIMMVRADLDSAAGQYALLIPVAYILGSIPWGFLIGLAVKGVDIRQYGSGKIGTSNVLRTAGGKFAALALALDLSKGLLAVLMARLVADDPAVEVVAGLAALAGHNWSVFLAFKGGRGIATGLGGLLIMQPIAGAIAVGAFLPITLGTRILSLGSIVSNWTAFIALLVMALLDYTSPTYLWYVGIGCALITWQHRDNIQRIIRGTERRLGQPAEQLEEPSTPGAGG